MVFQCKDAASAGDLSKLLITKMQEPPDKNSPQQMDSADVEKLKQIFKPVVDGDKVKMSVDQDTLDNVVIPIMIKNSERRAHQRPPTPDQQPMPGEQPMPGDQNNPGGPPPGPGGL